MRYLSYLRNKNIKNPTRNTCVNQLNSTCKKHLAMSCKTCVLFALFVVFNLCSLCQPHQFSTLTSGRDAQNTSPNILLITSDQQRTDSINAYNVIDGKSSSIQSPNLDRLASEGVIFKDSFSVSPVCSPCRNSLLTGVHVPVHGVVENTVTPHKAGLTTYPDLLEKEGYYNLLIGKSHFSPMPKSFHYTNVHTGNTDMRCQNYTECDIDEDDFLETYLVNDAMDQIKKHVEKSSEDPFFLHLSFVSPHPPSTPPSPWESKYVDADLPDLNYRPGDIEKLPNQTRILLGLTENPPETQSRAKAWLNEDGTPNYDVINKERRLYYGLCAYVDEQVGRIVDFVDSAGIGENTLVIFTSDHGSFLYDHGIDNDKHGFMDSSLRVPLIMRMKGTLPANVTKTFASTLDVTASVLGAANVVKPNQIGYGSDANTTSFFMSGYDLFSPMKMNERVYHKQLPRRAVASTEFRGYAVCTTKYKLMYFTEQDEVKLFDRINDLNEVNDLSTNKDYDVVKNKLLLALLRWRSQQDDLQWAMENWDSAAEVGIRARDDASVLSGIVAEENLQVAADIVDKIVI